MSTRGTIGFRIDGMDKLSYNHSDSYPSGLGVSFVKQVRKLAKGKKLVEKVRALRVVTNLDTPTPYDVERFGGQANLSVGNQTVTDWYCLLRGYQGDLPQILKSGVMLAQNQFIYDSLFCEHGYILNLDLGMAEFYRGFQKTPGRGRYAATKWPNSEYYGCELVASFPMAEIPKD